MWSLDGYQRYGRLWACWNNLALRRKPKNLHANSNSSSFRDLSVQTEGRTDGRSTRLVILIMNIYIYIYLYICGRKRLLLPVTHFPTILYTLLLE